jgi:hypothetical protein
MVYMIERNNKKLNDKYLIKEAGFFWLLGVYEPVIKKYIKINFKR